ncbi:uncharacterized protein [Euwallacea similis]|uniref:uncharacterized protein n=1 Tax=Euwallacea similis TaxID=1736056 RepID=UPI00344EE568
MNCGALSRANLILTLFPDSCNRALKELPYFNFKTSFLGCELTVLWSRYPPFTYPLTNPHGWRGILFDFLKPLNHLSGRNIIFSGDDTEYFSQIANIYSYEEVLEDLENETLLFAGPAHLSTAEIFDISVVLFDDRLIIVVPRTMATQWSSLASMISVQNLFFGISIFVIVAMLIFYINKRNNRKFAASLTKVMLMEFRVLVGGGGGFSLTLTDSLLRLFAGTILLQYMVFSFFFQATTISSLTSGPIYEPPIKDIEQFLKSGHVMKMTRMNEMHLQYAKTFDPVSEMLLQHSLVVDEYDMLNVLDEMIKERKSATFALSGKKNLLLMRPNAEKTFTTFEYLIIHFGVAMKKNQYSSPQLQSWIFQLVEAGFLSRFINLHRNELVLKYSVDMEKRKTNMDLKQFLLVMRILVCGYLISIVPVRCCYRDTTSKLTKGHSL